MRHGKSGRKFNMDASQRRAMMRSLVVALLKYEQIRTTLARAKEVRRMAERTITWGTRLGDLLGKEHDQLSAEERARLVHAKRMVRKALGVNPPWRSAEERSEIKDEAVGAEGGARYAARDQLDVIDWLFSHIAPRFVGRPGGYTRIRREAKVRPGDAAPMAIIQLLPEEESARPAAKGKGGKAEKGAEAKGGKAAKGAEPKAAKAKGGESSAAKAKGGETKAAAKGGTAAKKPKKKAEADED